MQFANLQPVPFHKVGISSPFWSPRLHTMRVKTAHYCLDRCHETGRVANFRRAAGLEEGGFEGIYFNDSDVYKVLEGVAYLLMEGEDPKLSARADEVIDAICAAQQPDGYLFTYYTLTGLENRWSDMGYHEAYCLGHMIEGAVAYHQATGKEKWLHAAKRAVAQMMDVIGPGKCHWVTGHQEIELALVKLYRHTGDIQYLDYARFLVSERGHGHLNSPDFARQNFHEAYCQDDLPAEELSKVTGHAVRAMYYYSAMADLAAIQGDEKLAAALLRLWDNVVPANLYITGGIGQDSAHEGFTRDWHLPNLTAYCETCAAIGMALWNQRMNLLFGEGKYADLVETELYNGILSGISLDGVRFFYDNPLSSVGKYQRSPWFGCSCCPTNLIRFLPSVGGYMYASGADALYVNQYMDSTAQIDHQGQPLTLRMQTEYPWKGEIALTLSGEGGPVKLRLRIPGWCQAWKLTLSGKPVSAEARKGYAEVEANPGDTVALSLEMEPRRVYGHEQVAETRGRVAFARGPVVYCAEEIDQSTDIPTEYLHAELTADEHAPISGEYAEELGGIVRLTCADRSLVPYYSWANRGRGGMAVWLKER